MSLDWGTSFMAESRSTLLKMWAQCESLYNKYGRIQRINSTKYSRMKGHTQTPRLEGLTHESSTNDKNRPMGKANPHKNFRIMNIKKDATDVQRETHFIQRIKDFSKRNQTF